MTVSIRIIAALPVLVPLYSSAYHLPETRWMRKTIPIAALHESSGVAFNCTFFPGVTYSLSIHLVIKQDCSLSFNAL
jgi:hypothetical protein